MKHLKTFAITFSACALAIAVSGIAHADVSDLIEAQQHAEQALKDQNTIARCTELGNPYGWCVDKLQYDKRQALLPPEQRADAVLKRQQAEYEARQKQLQAEQEASRKADAIAADAKAVENAKLREQAQAQHDAMFACYNECTQGSQTHNARHNYCVQSCRLSTGYKGSIHQ